MRLVWRVFVQIQLALLELGLELIEFLEARRLLVGHINSIYLKTWHDLILVAFLRLPVLDLLDELIDRLQLVINLLIVLRSLHLLVGSHVAHSQLEVVTEEEK